MTMQQQAMGGSARDGAASLPATATDRAEHQRLAWTTPSVTTVDVAELTRGASGAVSDGITVES